MSSFRSPQRGGNIVHRLEFQPPPRRRKRSETARLGADRQGTESAPAVRPQPAPQAPAPAPAGDASQRQLALLERRLEKMARVLEERDRLIAAGLSRSPDDPGIASIYREVQGIHGDGTEARKRKEFMSQIFKANLKLQESVRTGPSEAE